MTLATHIVVAGAAASPFFSNPILSFFVGLLSHYIIDAIPHWDRKVNSITKDSNGGKHITNYSFKNMFLDVGLVIADLLTGLIILSSAIYYSQGELLWAGILLAAFGGALPDGLQFLYFMFKGKLLVFHQEFHDFVHSEKKISEEDNLKGVLMQIPLIIISVIVIIYIKFP